MLLSALALPKLSAGLQILQSHHHLGWRDHQTHRTYPRRLVLVLLLRLLMLLLAVLAVLAMLVVLVQRWWWCHCRQGAKKEVAVVCALTGSQKPKQQQQPKQQQ